MEYHEIGERFEYKGVVLEVTTPGYCSDCYFFRICRCGYVLDSLMYCGNNTRNDKESISYKLVEQLKPKDMEQKITKRVEDRDKAFEAYVSNPQSDEEIYGSLLDKLFTTYKAKNHDYSNAFSEMFDELGIDYAYGKLREKINRIKALRKQPNMVENEGLEDALLDTAGYAILTLVELKKKKGNGI